MMMNHLPETIHEIIVSWKDDADKAALQYSVDNVVVRKTFQMLYEDVSSISCMLLEGGYEGAHVAIVGSNSYEWICAWYGVVNIGGVAVAINKDFSAEEIEKYSLFSDSAILLYEKGMEKKLECLKERKNLELICIQDLMSKKAAAAAIDEMDKKLAGAASEKDFCAIMFTSGTTGKPKAVMHSHESMIKHYIANSVFESGDNNKEDYEFNYFIVMPLHHVISLEVVFLALLHHWTSSICSSLKYFIKDLVTIRPTEMMLVPQLISLLCEYIQKAKELDVASGIKEICSAGASVLPGCWKILSDHGVVLIQNYGATETSGDGMFSTVRNEGDTSIGRPHGTTVVDIIDHEIVIKSEAAMLGYYKDPEETASVLKNGWYYTGDLGYIDAEGYVYMTGRKKNLIILSNGENISPEEIENILAKGKEIHEIMVFGMNDRLCAEIFPVAAADEEKQKMEIERVVKEYNKSVPTYRQIRKILYRNEEFPKTATNKIKRVLVKE